jgi:serine/threonine-protein kinase
MTDRTEAGPADRGEPAAQLWGLWRDGRRPDVRAFLGSAGALAPLRLACVLCVDQGERWQLGERPQAEEYLRGWPALLDDPEAALDVVFNEFLLREQLGEAPAPEEYQRRFPQLAEPFRQQLDFHRVVVPSGAPAAACEPRAAVALEVVAGPHRGQRFQIGRHETFLVGRAPDVNLQLIDDAHFSRHHFLLEVNPPRCYLRDLGSSNGTFVNGERVRERFLRDGDVISGGKTRIRVSLPGHAPPPTLTRSAVPAPSLAGAWRTEAAAGSGVPVGGAVQPVPGYHVERLLGQGGMGAVYLARRAVTGEPCALKVILPESAADERAMKRFLREVSVLSQLRHPRIVRFQEMGIHHGQFFFAMEYVPAVNLRDELTGLAEHRRVPLVSALACQVLEGLDYAHAQGFVHRDIKPANVLVARAGGLSAKLADFGLAKNFENAGFSGMTHEGQVLGTVPFMAPEQVAQARSARPAVDLYSVGATLYHLLSGRYPHDFGQHKDPLAVILQEAPAPLRRHCPSAPEGLAAVIHRALARDPACRFPSASAMREALLPYAGASCHGAG